MVDIDLVDWASIVKDLRIFLEAKLHMINSGTFESIDAGLKEGAANVDEAEAANRTSERSRACKF